MTQPTPIRRVPDGAPRLLGLCAGYGGLETAAAELLGATTVAYAENDPFAARVFAAHHPGVPNLGDITTADWGQAAALGIDAVAAGFPCRNISNAGRKDGINGQWSRVWKNVAEAVRHLRPRLVLLENVAAIRSRGLDVVAQDLAAIGYDARWTCLRAGDPEIGAPHPRDRWFAVAHPADADPHHLGRHWRTRHQPETQGRPEPPHRRHPAPPALRDDVRLLPTPVAADARGTANFRADGTPYGTGYGHTLTDAVRSLLPTPAARDWKSGASNLLGRNSRPLNEVVVNLLAEINRDVGQWIASDGTDYGPAIRRWEQRTGRPAPCPTEPGTRGNRRLAPAFAEWLMGLPAGWVTDVADIPRKEQLRILGNGVVPQQALHAYTTLLGLHTTHTRTEAAA
ncbi:DNA cytosine methyltransferase [Streptomyces sp. S399]|uniref:DNA (cytosine-5-)-methyltransferase n=3 Tax=Streptomyces TaxID=1883 RepID=A0A380MP06_STRGR|nr:MULTISPECIES: DNA cytosine methyltransferase [Streptomyces]WPR52682.1 DNA cytosine methyltransferase [Streptomyces sp. S399]SUO93998.1 C-5 cytosine-specific DNA methylase [Streptomyces griseus]